jgi:putative aldouronate transport system permease protein
MSNYFQSRQDRVFDVVNFILLTFATLIVLYPLVFMISASLSNPLEIYKGNVWLLPKGFTMSGYQKIFSSVSIWMGYKNTIFYTLVGTVVNIALTVTAAYPLSRKDFFGKKYFMIFFTITLFFHGGMIPTYLVVKSLGLVNNFWVMILPNAVVFWNVVITRTYFQNVIPDELREAAAIDGCSNIKLFVRIVLPLSAPILAVISLYYGVSHWNAFFNALLYLTDRNLFPLQLVLREILLQSKHQSDIMGSDYMNIIEQQNLAELIKYGVIIVSSLPVLMLYPFLQRYFIKGIMVGSLKG